MSGVSLLDSFDEERQIGTVQFLTLSELEVAEGHMRVNGVIPVGCLAAEAALVAFARRADRPACRPRHQIYRRHKQYYAPARRVLPL